MGRCRGVLYGVGDIGLVWTGREAVEGAGAMLGRRRGRIWMAFNRQKQVKGWT